MSRPSKVSPTPNWSKATQTRLTNVAQRYPAAVASMSFLAVIFFYVAAACAFA